MPLEKLQKLIAILSDDSKSHESKLIEFREYIESIKDIGSFNKTKWSQQWRVQTYDLGQIFKKLDASDFLLITKEIKGDEDVESIDFTYSEIIWAFFDQENEYVGKELKSFAKKYPGNLEFHHSYSQYLLKNQTFKEALYESKFALNLEKDNAEFLKTFFNTAKIYFDHLVEKAKDEEARAVLDDVRLILTQKEFENAIIYKNALTGLYDRLKDHIVINRRIEFFEKEVQRIANIEQKRFIEILGIFSAIMAFILTNISIATAHFTFSETLRLMIAMAIVLLIFAISISYLFSIRYRYNKSNFFRFLAYRKFWAIVVLIGCLILLLWLK